MEKTILLQKGIDSLPYPSAEKLPVCGLLGISLGKLSVCIEPLLAKIELLKYEVQVLGLACEMNPNSILY